jgi:hypothetical protein
MKIFISTSIFVFIFSANAFFSVNVFCQTFLYDSLQSEYTKINPEEKKVFEYLVKVYSERKAEVKDCEDCFNYVLNVFTKIDSLERFFYLSRENQKEFVASKMEMLVGKEVGGYFGDKVSITINPDLNLGHGYISMQILYPAAGVSEANIIFVINKDIYESYKYFTSTGGGYELFSFKVNAIEKYKGQRERPYEIILY